MATIAVPETRIITERQLEGKIALITGASRGIGRAIAMELAHRGASVAVNFRTSQSAAEELRREIHQAGGDCELFQGDISDPNHARRLIGEVVGHFQRIDILVNNAGITRDRSIRKMTEDDWA